MAARQNPLTCSGHTRPVVDLHYSPQTPDGFFLISACKDGKPMLRSGQTGDWLGTFDGHKGAVWGARLDRKALRAATGSADFTAKIWDTISGDVLHSFDHPHIVKSVDFNEDTTGLLTGCNDKHIRHYDLGKPEAEPLVLKGHAKTIKRVLYSPLPHHALSGGEDKIIRLWDLRTAEVAKSVQLDSAITNMELSWDESLVTVTHGRKIFFLDAKTLEKTKEFEAPSPVHAASVHPDKKSFVWGGMDNVLHVVDFDTSTQLEEYKGHFGPVHCVQFSPDGEIYASGSEDGTVRLWQTRVGTEYGLWRLSKPGEDGNTAAPAAPAGPAGAPVAAK